MTVPVTLENYDQFRITVPVGPRHIHFFVFNGQRMEIADVMIWAMNVHFRRIPAEHTSPILPFFLFKERPAGGHGGGTYPDISILAARNPTRQAQHDEAWGAPHAVVQEAVSRYAPTGGSRTAFHAIPLRDWMEPGRATTVIHEFTHAIDNRFHLTQRANPAHPERRGPSFDVDDFPTSLPDQICGHGDSTHPLHRYVVNAYCSMITGFPGIHDASVVRSIIAKFRESRAFQIVPDAWWHATFPRYVH